ncbi:MAG: ABC transporter ATP-binding protein [Acidimicrobiales bacterium]
MPALSPLPAADGGPLRRLLPFLSTSRRDLGLALGASVLGQMANGLGPLIQKVLIDDVIIDGRRSAWLWLVALATAALTTFGLAFVRRWFGGRVAFRVQHELRTAVFDRLMRLDFAGHDRLQTGQLVSRSSSDLGLIQSLLSTTPLMLGNVVLIVVALVAMVALSPRLAVVTAVAVPLLGVLSFRLRRTVFPATWDAQQRAAEVAGVVDEAVSGVRIVKGFGAEQRELDRLAQAAERLFASRVRLLRLQARTTSTLAAVPSLAQVAVLAYGGWLALHGRLTLGTLLAFASYLVQLVPPMRMTAWVVAAAEQARAGAERILDILDANANVTDPPDGIDLRTARGEVRFEHVRFGYERSRPVLVDFDLHIAAGEVVALVGASGSGKSTVTAVLPRFYDPADGRVLVDGHDVRSLALGSLRRQIGVAFEDAFLFSDTLAANIAYGRPDASDAEIRAAADTAGAAGFIDSLPDGYQTVVGERGVTLSGGQRQRVALARAVLGDPAVLILDAATSAVDSSTEEAIHAALADVVRGRTTILIAHRLSTVRLAQRVVLVEHGRVADQGTHDELAARNPAYRALLGLQDEDVSGGDVLGGDVVGVDVLGGDVVGDGAWAGPGGRVGNGWPDPTEAPRARLELANNAAGHGGGSHGSELAATPKLLAALASLPPASARSGIDVAAASSGRERGQESGTSAGSGDESFRIGRFVRPWRRRLGLGVALVAADALLTVLGPVLIRYGIDEGVRPGNQAVLWRASILFGIVVVVDWAVMLAGALLTSQTAEAMLASLRIRIFAHLQRLSLEYYDKEMDGRIMTRMTSDVEALSQLVQTGLINAVVGGATCVGVAVFLVILSPTLALTAASVLPVLWWATRWYRRGSAEAYRDSREAIASVNANFQENMSGVRVAQANAAQGRSSVQFNALSDAYRAARMRSQRLLSLYFPGIGLLADLAAIAVLAVSISLVDAGRTTPAVVIAFLLYLNLFFAPLQQLSQVFDTWQQATSSTVKITELLLTPSSTPPPVAPIDPGVVRGEVRFERVWFGYDPTATSPAYALADLDLIIAPGETLALVGETGAGKSTVVRLLARFADPTRGRVLVDGIDLREVDLDAYRRQLGVVPQEPFLFTGTVRDNIAYGRPDATDEEVEAAARAVGAHRFITTLERGYHSAISERGRSLSAGQRQLLALARAQLVQPRILLLDEATANLDLGAEAVVRRAMAQVSSGRTTILVAHRLATSRQADRIAVLAQGRLVELGSHDELLAAGGRYAELWAASERHGVDGPSSPERPGSAEAAPAITRS